MVLARKGVGLSGAWVAVVSELSWNGVAEGFRRNTLEAGAANVDGLCDWRPDEDHLLASSFFFRSVNSASNSTNLAAAAGSVEGPQRMALRKEIRLS